MIVPTLARMIIREHLFKPIRGKLLCLGRQSIDLTYDQFIELLKQENYPLPKDYLSLKKEIDQDTRNATGKDWISDDTFFRVLGIDNVQSMDVSKYEGADIIHNINNPIPEELANQFDFIIDGGTFDHLLDVRMGFENVVKMLKPNGRIFQWNAASNFTGCTYVSFGPDLFYDYYVVNRFADCKVYIAEVDRLSQPEFWDMYEFDGSDEHDHFRSDRIQMVVVLAEKGPASTYDKMPIQTHYRDKEVWQEYRECLKSISLSPRKPLSCLSENQKPLIPCESKVIIHTRSLATRIAKKGGIRHLLRKLVELPLEQKKLNRLKGFNYIGKL